MPFYFHPQMDAGESHRFLTIATQQCGLGLRAETETVSSFPGSAAEAAPLCVQPWSPVLSVFLTCS